MEIWPNIGLKWKQIQTRAQRWKTSMMSSPLPRLLWNKENHLLSSACCLRIRSPKGGLGSLSMSLYSYLNLLWTHFPKNTQIWASVYLLIGDKEKEKGLWISVRGITVWSLLPLCFQMDEREILAWAALDTKESCQKLLPPSLYSATCFYPATQSGPISRTIVSTILALVRLAVFCYLINILQP